MWQGAPDFVIEILSPSTAYRDRGVKFETYEKYGVSEYWLIDPELKFVEIYRQQDKTFKRQGIYKSGQTFTSSVLGDVSVPVNALFAE